MHLLTASSASSVTMTAYPLPASPTLTNPDMILPYREHDGLSSQHWNENLNDFHFSDPSIYPDLSLMAPRTPIIYGNGTVLSDIGEVTEAECTTGGQSDKSNKKVSKSSLGYLPWRSGFMVQKDDIMGQVKARSHRRNISIESTSTIGEQCSEIFKDVDDNLSVDDSVFQGDDEESVADSDSHEIIASELRQSILQGNVKSDYDEHPSAALSKRAEQILLNAKRRLNTMEGNLNLARDPIPVRKTGSVSSVGSLSPLNRSTPSPTQNELRSNSQARSNCSSRKQTLTPSQSPNGSSIISREYCENAASTFTATRTARSADAGSRFLSRSESPPSNSTSEPAPTRGRTFPRPFLASAGKPSYRYLEPLCEDNEASGTNPDRTSIRSNLEADLFQPEGPKTTSRPASLTQIKEIQYQMQGLKGKLSLLRDRARDDNVKRRSLQSLRTPSPFTVAEQWCQNGNDHFDEPLRTDEEVSRPPYLDSDEKYERTKIDDSRLPAKSERENQNMGSCEIKAETTVDDCTEGIDKEDIDDCASDTSHYHDTMVSHEDREDAFDYEHFFLHSAMGTISREKRHSFSSEGSVETTRGLSVPSPGLKGLCRSASTATLSTIASFETAYEDYETKNNNKLNVYNLAVQLSQEPRANQSQPTTEHKYSRSNSDAHKSVTSRARRPSRNLCNKKSGRYIIHRSSSESLSPSGSSESSTPTYLFSSNKTDKAESTTHSSFGRQLSPERKISLEHNSHIDVSTTKSHKTYPVELLAKDDQALLRELVASLSKCAVGLQEANTGHEAYIWRNRLEAARRILEGLEEGGL